MAPDVPVFTMGVATPGGGALVAYFETARPILPNRPLCLHWCLS